MFKHLFFITIIMAGIYYYWTERPVVHGPGVVAPAEPAQQRVYGIRSFSLNAYDIEPIAEFNIEARVLAKKSYSSDRLADVAPYDFVLGWGPMSDERNIENILITQSGRYFHWELSSYPIPQQEMIQHSANVHLIPSSDEISEKISDVRRGHIVRISGYLVTINGNDGWSLRSSLRRNDFGYDASEIVWIEEFEIL